MGVIDGPGEVNFCSLSFIITMRSFIQYGFILNYVQLNFEIRLKNFPELEILF